MTEEAPRHVFLVDGSGYIFRAFHALPPMTRPDGTPVNAVYGFTAMLMRLVEDTDADRIAIVFDVARTTFRNDIYPDYKANRDDPPPELVPQFALIRDAVKALNLQIAELPGYEADDIIATYARRAAALGAEVTIVSSDKDLMQLVDERISLFDPVKQRRIGGPEVVERFGVPPEKVVDVQALAGDSSDNVPGVPGIGVKTAAQLIGEYGDLDTLLARADEIRQPKRRSNLIEFAEQARVSRELVLLRDDAPVAEDLDAFAVPGLDPARLRPFLEEQGFASIIARLGSAGEEEQPAAPVEAEYELVTEEESLQRWVEAGFDAGIVAIDTETDSLDAQRARLVGISLAVAPGKACYVPVGHDLAAELLEAEAPRQLSPETALAVLEPLFSSNAVLKVGQNIKYDMEVLAGHGIRVAPIDDTMVLSYVLDGSSHGHGMDELARLHLGHECIGYESVCGKGRNAITFDKVALDKALDYAAEDADITLRLREVLRPRLREERMAAVYETIERPLIPVLADMENAGIKVDVAALNALSKDFARRIGDLEQEIHGLAGRPFNIGSPKQLGEILFDEMSLPGGKKGKTGAYATGAEILEDLRAQGHDLPARVLDWRQLSKLRSTYTEALAAAAHPGTQRVHTSFSQAVAGHGAPVLQRPQPPEHSRAHRGRPQDPPRLHCRTGPSAGQRGLFADRAAPARPCRGNRAAEDGLPCRPRHPCAHRLAGVRAAGGRHGPDDAPARQGDQFRHHLRHFALRPLAPASDPAGRGTGLYRCLFRALSRHPRLYGPGAGLCAQARLCADHIRAEMPDALHRRQEPRPA